MDRVTLQSTTDLLISTSADVSYGQDLALPLDLQESPQAEQQSLLWAVWKALFISLTFTQGHLELLQAQCRSNPTDWQLWLLVYVDAYLCK
jgi:hypothetical protein